MINLTKFTTDLTNEFLASTSTKPLPTAQLISLVGSKYEKEKLIALKQILTHQMTPDLYSAVVQQVGNLSMETKTLVYSLVGKYAQEYKELSLLAVNVVAKECRSSSFGVSARCLAIKTLADLSVEPVLYSILVDTCRDSHAWVRRTSVFALSQLLDSDASYLSRIQESLEANMQQENSVQVIGAYAWLIKRHFSTPDALLPLVDKVWKKWTRMLLDLDQDAQVAVLDLFTSYSRLNFVSNWSTEQDLPEELACLLETSLNLLYSNSPSPVLATVAMHLALLPPNLVSPKLAKALLKLLNTDTFTPILAGPGGEDAVSVVSRDILVQDTLTSIQSMLTISRLVFQEQFKCFYLHPIPFESKSVRGLKLEILGRIVTEANLQDVWSEFLAYLHGRMGGSNAERHDLILQTLGATKNLITKFEAVDGFLENVGRELMSLLSGDGKVVEEVVAVVRLIMLKKPSKNALLYLYALIIHTPRRNDGKDRELKPLSREARANVLGILADWIFMIPDEARECLRVCLKDFSSVETVRERRALLRLAVCVCLDACYPVKPVATLSEELQEPKEPVTNGVQTERVEAMLKHLLTLLKFDADYDLRDTSRFVSGLNESGFSNYLRRIFERDDAVEVERTEEEMFKIDSFAAFFQRRTADYTPWPDWCTVPRDAQLRNVDNADNDPWLNPSKQSTQTSFSSASPRMSPNQFTQSVQKEVVKKEVKKRVVNLDVWFDSEPESESESASATDQSRGESDEEQPISATKATNMNASIANDKDVKDVFEEFVERESDSSLESPENSMDSTDTDEEENLLHAKW